MYGKCRGARRSRLKNCPAPPSIPTVRKDISRISSSLSPDCSCPPSLRLSAPDSLEPPLTLDWQNLQRLRKELASDRLPAEPRLKRRALLPEARARKPWFNHMIDTNQFPFLFSFLHSQRKKKG